MAPSSLSLRVATEKRRTRSGFITTQGRPGLLSSSPSEANGKTRSWGCPSSVPHGPGTPHMGLAGHQQARSSTPAQVTLSQRLPHPEGHPPVSQGPPLTVRSPCTQSPNWSLEPPDHDSPPTPTGTHAPLGPSGHTEGSPRPRRGTRLTRPHLPRPRGAGAADGQRGGEHRLQQRAPRLLAVRSWHFRDKSRN